MPRFSHPADLLAHLRTDTFAGLTTLAALALPVVVGAAGLAFDLNRGYQQRIINQRAADMAALGAAMAFQSAKDAAILTPTAQDIAIANGLADAAVSAELVSDFPNPGDQSVRVTVRQQLPVTLGRVIGAAASYHVSAQSLAGMSGEPDFAAPCYLALSSGSNAFALNGGASVEAPGCAVAAVGKISNNGDTLRAADIISGASDIYLNYGTLDANSLRFAGRFEKQSWNNKVPPADRWFNEPTTLADPWANDPTRIAAMALLGDHAPVPTLADPVTPGGPNYIFNPGAPGPTRDFQEGNRSFVVPPGTYDIGRLQTSGNVDITFANGSIIRIADGVKINGSSSIDFGDSDVYVNGGFESGPGGVTLGDGVLWIGSGSVSFEGTNRKGDGDVIINATTELRGGQHLIMGSGNHYFGRLVVGGGGSAQLGAGDFTVVNGLRISGDSEVSLGDGDVIIGRHSNDPAIRLEGSARFFMGDGEFSAVGDIHTVGGSRLVFGKTSNHYIAGDLTVGGSVLFGKGRYTIDGDFTNGTGGTTWPYTSPYTGRTYGDMLEGVNVSGYDQAGIGVTFVLSGTMNLAGGAKTWLEAPMLTQLGGAIGELLVTSHSSERSNWNAGSHNRFGGTIHLPNSALTMAGGNSTLATRCMSLIASTITLSGGAATAIACDMMRNAVDGSSDTTIRLVG